MASPEKAKRPAWSAPADGAKPGLGQMVPVTEEDRLKRVLGETFAVDEDLVTLETRVDGPELEFDSLDCLEFSMALEEAFGIEFSEDAAFEKFETLGDWLREVRRLMRGVVPRES